jgi:hypothetical protein
MRPLSKVVQAADLAVGVMREDQAAASLGMPISRWLLRVLVGHGEQQKRRAALGLPDAFHRGDLLRLVLQRVQAVQIATKDLQRDQQCAQRQPGAQRLAAPRPCP